MKSLVLLYTENMLGVILASLGTLFEEIAASIGKEKIRKKEESPYTYGFLSLMWGFMLFGLFGLFRQDAFVFSVDSLPTFGIRAILEIAQVHFTILALTQADRSTFGFFRILTVPLLLAVDMALGYALSPAQICGYRRDRAGAFGRVA